MTEVAKSADPQGFDFYDDPDRLLNSALAQPSITRLFNYRPAVTASLLATVAFVAAAVLFWLSFGKSKTVFSLISAILTSASGVVVLVGALLLCHSQAHRDSVLFDEVPEAKNKEVFVALGFLVSGVSAVALAAMTIADRKDVTAESTLTVAAIPTLVAGIFSLLAVANIVFNLTFKFTLNLLALNVSLLSSFVLSCLGLTYYLILSGNAPGKAEGPYGPSAATFPYLFGAVLVTAFANCLQAAIKRRKILAVFGLVLFALSLLGLVFSAVYLRGSAASDGAKIDPKLIFSEDFVSVRCSEGIQRCESELWNYYFEKNQLIAFLMVVSLSFLTSGALFDFVLAKEKMDPPTNFTLFAFSCIILAIGIAFGGYFIKLAVDNHTVNI